MVWVKVRMENGNPAFYVEDQAVDPDRLQSELRNFVKATRKTQLLLQIDDEVPHGVEVAVFDAAKGAGIERVSLALPGKQR